MNIKPKIILVTGFLGSGKTTLLNRLIKHYKSKKIGLIINDFGQIAIDDILLNDLIQKFGNSKNSIYEISNGSIFCSCLSTELVKSLKHFAEIKPDILFIETSGLSDPSTFGIILEKNKLDEVYDIEASFCIIDSIRSMKLANKIVAIEKQIKSSNIVVINKTDLISDEEYNKIVKFVQDFNKTASILKSKFAEIDLSIIGTKQKSQYMPEAETCNTFSTRPGSMIIRQINISKDELINFFNLIKEKVLRIKGFYRIDEENYYISDNNDKLQIEKTEHVIGQLGLSVLLPKNDIEIVETEWINISKNKI